MNAPVTWDPRRAVLALLVLTHAWRLQDLVGALAPLKLLTLATGIAVGAELLVPGALRRFADRIRHPAVASVAILLGLGALSVPGSLYPGLSLEFFLKNQLDAALLLFLLVLGIRSGRDVELLVWVALIGGVVYTTTVLLRYDVGPDGRLGDLVYYDANDLGMLLVCTLPLAVHCTWRGRTLLLRVVAAAATALFLVGIIRSGSRGAFLGMVAVALYIVWRGHQIPLRWRLGAVAAGALLLVGASSDRYWAAMGSLLHPDQDYNWVGREPGGRMEVWKRGVGYMAQHPLFGVGVGAFPVAEGTISPLAARQTYGGGIKWSAAHNSFVQIGAELGVGGLIAFITMLAVAYRSAARDRQGVGAALAASICGYAVSGFFLSQAYAPFLYTLVALAARTGIPPRREVVGPDIHPAVVRAPPRRTVAAGGR